jgi:hypothetical protein
MENDRSWYYVPAYTDPVIDLRYFVDWAGPQATHGFTFNPKVFGGREFEFHMATSKLGDPQWRGHEGCKLALDYYAPQPFAELTVKLVENDGQPSQREFTLKVEPQSAGEGWRTITITPGDAKASDGKVLKGWGEVNTLALVGKSTQSSPPVFHNLRWME